MGNRHSRGKEGELILIGKRRTSLIDESELMISSDSPPIKEEFVNLLIQDLTRSLGGS